MHGERAHDSTLIDLLQRRAVERPEFPVYSLLRGDGKKEGGYTFSEIDRLARSVAVTLGDDMPVGERAVLLFPSGLDFLSAFFGCLYGGIVGVPVQMHGFSRLPQMLPRILDIARAAGARTILTTAAMLEKIAALPEVIEGSDDFTGGWPWTGSRRSNPLSGKTSGHAVGGERRLPPVHLRFDVRAEGRGTHAPQSAREHALFRSRLEP